MHPQMQYGMVGGMSADLDNFIANHYPNNTTTAQAHTAGISLGENGNEELTAEEAREAKEAKEEEDPEHKSKYDHLATPAVEAILLQARAHVKQLEAQISDLDNEREICRQQMLLAHNGDVVRHAENRPLYQHDFQELLQRQFSLQYTQRRQMELLEMEERLQELSRQLLAAELAQIEIEFEYEYRLSNERAQEEKKEKRLKKGQAEKKSLDKKLAQREQAEKKRAERKRLTREQAEKKRSSKK